VFVVEQNRDAQMRSLMLLETRVEQDKLVPILHYNGMPIPSHCIVKHLQQHLVAEVAA
jgi:2-oxoglutarate ferredoxin oxidoreductase subunit alpha